MPDVKRGIAASGRPPSPAADFDDLELGRMATATPDGANDAFGLASHQQEIGIGRLGQPGKQLGPLGFRPVLAFAAAAPGGWPATFLSAK